MLRIFGRPATANRSGARIVSFTLAVKQWPAAPQWRLRSARESPSILPLPVHTRPETLRIWKDIYERYVAWEEPDAPVSVPTQEQIYAAKARVGLDLMRYGDFVHQRLLQRGIEDEAAESAIIEACVALTFEYAIRGSIKNAPAYMILYALGRLLGPDPAPYEAPMRPPADPTIATTSGGHVGGRPRCRAREG
jgi:hypothetical protein